MFLILIEHWSLITAAHSAIATLNGLSSLWILLPCTVTISDLLSCTARRGSSYATENEKAFRTNFHFLCNAHGILGVCDVLSAGFDYAIELQKVEKLSFIGLISCLHSSKSSFRTNIWSILVKITTCFGKRNLIDDA